MNEFNFEEMLNSYLPSKQNSGDVVEGTIVRKDDEYAFLNINNKLEGLIRLSEVADLNIGDKVSGIIVKQNEEFLIISKNSLERKTQYNEINKGDVVKGIILKRGKTGYDVKVGLLNATLPYRLSALNKEYIPDNTEFNFEVIEKRKGNLTLSRIDVIKKEEEEFLNSISLNDIVSGVISKKLDYGLIVDLGKINALIHASELSWNKDKTLKNFSIGDKIEAKVIELIPSERKIKLSIKQLEENPWLKIREKYTIGQNIDAYVKEVFNFGVVVDLGNDHDELIHISNLFNKGKYINPMTKFEKGDLVLCEVIGIDDEKEKIILSSKTVFDKIWENIEDIYALNDILNVTITKIENFGIFSKTQENIEIFVPKSELSWDRNFESNFKIGDKIDVKLFEIKKEDKNLVGSIKRLGKSPFDIANSKFMLNEEYEVEVKNILDNGVLVQLTDDFKGLILKKDLSDNEVINVGDKIKAIVIEKNNKKCSILLSVRKIKEIEEKKEFDELMKEYGV